MKSVCIFATIFLYVVIPLASAAEGPIYRCTAENLRGLLNQQTITYIPKTESYVGIQNFVNDNEAVEEPITYGHAKNINSLLILTEQVPFQKKDFIHIRVIDTRTLDYAEYSIMAGVQSTGLTGHCEIP